MLVSIAMGTAIAFITTIASTPTKRSRSPVSHGDPNWLLSPFRNPNFTTKRSPKSPSPSTTPMRAYASSAIGAANEALDASSPGLIGANDLLIVGPGVLGRLVAEKWREDHLGCQIFGQTMTSDHHDELINIGINPSLKGTKATNKFPYVVFCAPPSRTPDYLGDVREAASSWSGEGSFLFTSSSAPYDCNDNGPCDEDSPVVPIGRSPRIDVLLRTENAVLESGGCVLRLAGLYKADRGAHMYWLKKGIVDSRPDHIINLIHYEDAATLLVAILKKKLRGQIFLGCDNHPLSRQEVMDIVSRSGKFSKKFEGFTGTDDPLGKKLNNTKTREEIGWEPKYSSFAQFFEVSE
ncbi:Protein YeeZ like [Actinidia chinensis var. chinensis]|uniref:Protein YeeZ like n=1 Tax=Actinidia chinensis var. chinensis TaxID=1590841 RepID=A0A2R6P4F4_ACTCC|nr:Protein YeeZ like [Actinidia chinensis var. chinensis]